MKTIVKVGLVAGLATALWFGFRSTPKLPEKHDTSINWLHPEVTENQCLIPINNGYERGYMLLTDLDRDRNWDLRERRTIGLTPGQYNREFYIKKGYSIPGFPTDTTRTEQVEAGLFDVYQ